MNDDGDDDVIFPVPPRPAESSGRLALTLLRAPRAAVETAWRIRAEVLRSGHGPALRRLAALAGVDLDPE